MSSDFTTTHSNIVLISLLLDGSDLDDWLSVTFDDEAMEQHDRRLAVGAVIAEEMRAAVYRDTGFRCSAGVAHNKVGLESQRMKGPLFLKFT